MSQSETTAGRATDQPGPRSMKEYYEIAEQVLPGAGLAIYSRRLDAACRVWTARH